jgi:LPXTG-site transpeptidase (sortase) family protein
MTARGRFSSVAALTVGGLVCASATLFVGSSTATATATATATDKPSIASNPALVASSAKGTGRNVASVRIPAIGVKAPLLSGVGDKVLERGLGLWPGTGKIGSPGNAVIAGHRTSFTRPLFDIHKLKKGDSIFFTTTKGVAEYRITKTQIVKPNALWITRPTRASTITLFACHPPHSTAYRWVVFAKLHSMKPPKASKTTG